MTQRDGSFSFTLLQTPARRGRGSSSCSGYAVSRGETAPDAALARELGAMGLL